MKNGVGAHGGRTPRSAADPLVGFFFLRIPRLRLHYWSWPSTADDFRTSMKPNDQSSSPGVYTAVSRRIDPSRPPHSIPDRHLPQWTDCSMKPAPVRSTFASQC